MSVEIRRATREDVPTILALIRALAEYERLPDEVKATEEDLLRDGFDERPAFEVLLAHEATHVIGFALYFYSYSTWNGRRALYLEDLFVVPEARGKGAGIALMSALARIAIGAKCRRFVWQVLDWNTAPIAFYESLGAQVLREWLSVRLEGAPLEALASRC